MRKNVFKLGNDKLKRINKFKYLELDYKLHKNGTHKIYKI